MDLNGHRVILIRDMQSLDKAIMSVDDYLMIASADHGKMFKSSIYNAIKVYMLELQPVEVGKIRDIEGNLIDNPDELPTKIVNYGQYSYRVEATDITAANLDKIAGYGLKVSEECYGRSEDTRLYQLDSCYSEDGSPNPELKDGYKTKILDWDWFKSGRTDGLQSTITKNMEYSYITQEEIEVTDPGGQTTTDTKNVYNTESIFERRMTIIDGLFKTINRGWGSLFRFVNYKNNSLTQTMYGQPAYANLSLGEMEILQYDKQFDINDKNPSGWVKFSDIGENYFGGITRGLPGDGHPGYWFWDEYLGWYWFTAKTFPHIFIESPLLAEGSLAEIYYGGTIDGNGNVVIQEARYDFLETACTSGQDLDELERILSIVPSLASYNTVNWIRLNNVFLELNTFTGLYPLSSFAAGINIPNTQSKVLSAALNAINYAMYFGLLLTLYNQVQDARAQEAQCMENQKKQGPWYDFRREWEVKFPRPCDGVYIGVYNYLAEEITGQYVLFPDQAVRYNLLRSLTDQELGNLLYIANQQKLSNPNEDLVYDNSLDTLTNSINYVKRNTRELVVNNLLLSITNLNSRTCQGYNGFNINEAMMDIFDKYAPVTQQGYIPAVYKKNPDGTLFEVPKNSKGEYITHEIVNLDQVDLGQYKPCGWAQFRIDSSGNQRTKHVYIPEKECWSDLSYGVLVKGECTSDSIPAPSLINEYENPGKCPFGLTKEEKEKYFDRKEYTVIFSGGNGSETGAGIYNRNNTVSISCTPSDGKVLAKWTSNVSGTTFASNTSNSTTFIMPESDVVITPVYEDEYVPGDKTFPAGESGDFTVPSGVKSITVEIQGAGASGQTQYYNGGSHYNSGGNTGGASYAKTSTWSVTAGGGENSKGGEVSYTGSSSVISEADGATSSAPTTASHSARVTDGADSTSGNGTAGEEYFWSPSPPTPGLGAGSGGGYPDNGTTRGGSAGAYAKITFPVTAGQKITYSAGSGGEGHYVRYTKGGDSVSASARGGNGYVKFIW